MAVTVPLTMIKKSFMMPIYWFFTTVISVPDQVADRLEPSDDSSGPSYIDYSERRSLPISIPDYQTVSQGGEKFVVSCCFNSSKW